MGVNGLKKPTCALYKYKVTSVFSFLFLLRFSRRNIVVLFSFLKHDEDGACLAYITLLVRQLLDDAALR